MTELFVCFITSRKGNRKLGDYQKNEMSTDRENERGNKRGENDYTICREMVHDALFYLDSVR
jgi:hypothetical protein